MNALGETCSGAGMVMEWGMAVGFSALILALGFGAIGFVVMMLFDVYDTLRFEK